MLFKFSLNPDGTYNIMNFGSKDQYYIEIENGSRSNGANVRQSTPSNSNSQKWKAITE